MEGARDRRAPRNFEEIALTTTSFARPPRNAVATVLQVTTVVVALLLGAAFATSMFTDGAEAQLRAAVGPVAAEQVGS